MKLRVKQSEKEKPFSKLGQGKRPVTDLDGAISDDANIYIKRDRLIELQCKRESVTIIENEK